MELTAQSGSLVGVTADAIVVNLFQGQQPAGATAAADKALGGAITRLIEAGDFKGRLTQTAVLYPAAGASETLKASRLILVGLGKQEEFTTDRARQVAATAARKARDLGVRSLATTIHGVGGGLEPHVPSDSAMVRPQPAVAGVLPPREASQAVAEGTLLGLYRFERHKSKRDQDEEGEGPRTLDQVTLVEPDADQLPAVEEGLQRGRILAESANFARDLITQPANVLSPRVLAEEARQMADVVGLRCEILEQEQLETLRMGALLGVARGSEEPCRFIILDHSPPGTEEQPPIVFCGKAITFDSGGISIKPSEGMWQMKDDMAGGAAVIGVLRALALLNVRQRVIGLVPATENMPSGRAIRPGDVLTAMDGQTIEIISTDAEGRLVLADALCYGHKYNPVAMLDVATLTGGVITALGSAAAGIMGNDDGVIARLKSAAAATGEKVWELPLWDDDYKKNIRSDIADMKNSGGRAASAIGGGMLLKQFAKKVPWAHLDIAGVAWSDSDSPYKPKGATGYGVRLLAEFAAAYTQ